MVRLTFGFYFLITVLVSLAKGRRVIIYSQGDVLSPRAGWLSKRARELLGRFTHGWVSPSLTRQGCPTGWEEGRGSVLQFLPFIASPKVKFVRRERAGSSGGIRVVMLAKLHPRKRIVEVLDAFSIYADCDYQLQILAEDAGQGAYSAHVLALIGEPPLRDRITFQRNAARSQVDEVLREADVLILASSREPCSFSQVEAMAYGVPAIVTADNGSACYVFDGVTGFVLGDGDFQGIVARVCCLARDSDRLLAMQRASLSFTGHYSGLFAARSGQLFL
jgi:glycosyltransferase involved in cell wall biosynthesis